MADIESYKAVMRSVMSDHAVHAKHEKEILGVTRDPVLRPVGTLLVVVGVLWSVFWGMAADAGTFGQPMAAAALIAIGVLVAGAGGAEEQI
jgi:hypothetical protein